MDLRKIFFVLIIATLSASDHVDKEDDTTSISRKERFLLATLKFRNERCQIGQERGVCKSWKECWLLRGKSVGSCPLGHGVCCQVSYTCGNVTSERVSYFVQPNDIPTTCSLTVNVYDRRVTQLRLDFERFSLEQPQRLNYNPLTFQYPAYFCYNDSFSVSSSALGSSGNLGFTNLCGENTGQHIYVPVNATTGSASVQLMFRLADRRSSNRLSQPQWRIRITQIDCCAPDTKDLCAPAGCLQYYPESSGQFESFNYDNGNGHYQGLLNYAICFKRYDGVCNIRYDANRFQIAASDLTNNYGEDGCNVPTTNPQEPNSRDYLFIPTAYNSSGVTASLFCGDALTSSNSVSTNAPGPMFVYFRTDGTSDDIDLGPEEGFQIRYSQSGGECYSGNSFQGFFG